MSAGITPELDCTSWIASTLKFENVAPPILGIGRVDAVRREDGCDAALAVHRELLREIRRAVGVGHGAGGQQQQLAEVARLAAGSTPPARKMLAAAGLG